MTDNDNSWARETLNQAVQDVIDRGVFADAIVEARATWALPGRILIGRVREPANGNEYWIIAGEVPADVIAVSAAATEREALRNIALKWQLDAERYDDPAFRKAMGVDEQSDYRSKVARMVEKAEMLYELATADEYWPISH